MTGGIVYILTNEAMPGYVKIGLTKQNDVGDRVKQLDNTSIPVPFECYFAADVADCRKVERTLHFVFGENRARRNREFFTIEPDLAKAIIELVAIKKVIITDEEQDIDPSERQDIEEMRSRREVRTFKNLNVPLDSTLTFVKDHQITCTVAGARKVLFRGQQMSLSAAALAVVNEMGYDWTAIQGSAYWAFNGVKLCDIRRPSLDDIEDDLD